jgi:hypothetical protein
MEEHRRQARLERETREREKEAMQLANAHARQEDADLAEERRKRAAEFMQECMAANSVNLRRKQRDREREIEEAQMMVEYQRERIAREEEAERREAERKAAREREIAALRKQQQKAIDTQAEVDALHARRIEEEKERRARKKELEDIERAKRLRGEMQQDRENALSLKQRRLIEMAKIEKLQFDQVQKVQAELTERDREREAKRQQDNAEYRQALKDEMQRQNEERALQPLVLLDETKHLDELNEDYVMKLERIRQMKLETLRAEGVPDKYLVDLQRMRFVPK